MKGYGAERNSACQSYKTGAAHEPQEEQLGHAP